MRAIPFLVAGLLAATSAFGAPPIVGGLQAPNNLSDLASPGSARGNLHSLPYFHTPDEYGAAGDAVRAYGTLISIPAAANPTLSLPATYEIPAATVSCVSGQTTISVTLPAGVMPGKLADGSVTYRISVAGCGASSGTYWGQLNGVSGSGVGPYTMTVDNAVGTTQTAHAEQVVIVPSARSTGASSTNAITGTYHQYRLDACSVSGVTLTCASAPFAIQRDLTQADSSGLSATYIDIQDPTGACPDFRTRILSTTTTVATLDAAYSCTPGGAFLSLWWGPLIFPSTAATGPTIAGSPWKVEVLGAGAAGVPITLPISAYIDPFHVTLTGTTATPLSQAQSSLTAGTDDSAALDSAAAAVSAGGFGVLYLQPGKSYLQTTGSTTALGAPIICNDGYPSGRIFWPAGSPSLKNAVRCVPGRGLPVPRATIAPDVNLRTSEAAVGPLTAVILSDSLFQNGSNGSGDVGSGDRILCDWLGATMRKPVRCYPLSIGGTELSALAPNGPNLNGNGAGIPSTAQMSVSAEWYTNTSRKWIDYAKAVCPHAVFLEFQNDGKGFLWSSYWDVITYMNSAGWQSLCGYTPDIIWITGPGQSWTGYSPATQEGVLFQQDFFRSAILAGDTPAMANGGAVGLLDFGGRYSVAVSGVDLVYSPPMTRAQDVVAPGVANSISTISLPYTWPRPVRDYSLSTYLNFAFGSSNITSATYWNDSAHFNGAVNMLLGGGSAGQPWLVGGQSSPAQISYTGNELSISRDSGGNIAYTGYTFRVPETATCAVSGTALSCSTSVANAGFYYAGIVIQGAGAAACPGDIGGANCLVTTIAAGGVSTDGKTIALAASGTLSSQSTKLVIYHTFLPTTVSPVSGQINNGSDGSPSCNSCGLQYGFTFSVRGPFAEVADGFLLNATPVFSGPVVRFGGRFTPTITAGVAGATTPSNQFDFAFINEGLSTSLEDADDLTQWTPTFTDYECWGEPPGYVGPEGGGWNAHMAIGCMTHVLTDLLAVQRGDAVKTVPGATVQNITANAQMFTLPPGAVLLGIDVTNTTGNAVTGGINVGSTSGASDIVSALTVGAGAFVSAQGSVLLKNVFSATAAQAIFVSAAGAWNSANLTIRVRYAL